MPDLSLILPTGVQLSGVVPLSGAFAGVPLPDGSVMLDVAAGGGSGAGGVDLTSPSGTLGVAHGGTGRSVLTTGALLYASGTSTTGQLGPTTTGKIVISAGTAPAYSLYSLPASFPKGSVPYGSASEQVSALLSPAAASVMVHAGGTGLPSWTTALPKAQQHAQTAYLDGSPVFTTDITLQKAAGSGATLNVMSTSPVGGTGFNSVVNLYATATIRSARFIASNASSAANRYVGINVEKDHDSNRLPFRVQTLDNTDSNIVGIEVGAGTSAGHVRYGGGSTAPGTVMVVSGTTNTSTTQLGTDVITICDASATTAVIGLRSTGRTAASAFTTATLASVWAVKPVLGAGSAATVSAAAYVEDGTGVGATSFSLYVAGGLSALNGSLGINLGTNVAPSAKLHVVETSSGAVPETVRLGNQSNTSGSGTEIGAHAATSGAQKYASIRFVTTAASAATGDIAFLTQRASSGGPVEVMRCDGKGSVSIGTAALAPTATDGFLYIPSSAGPPTGVPTAKTGLVPVHFDSTNNKWYVYNGAWKSVTLT